MKLKMIFYLYILSYRKYQAYTDLYTFCANFLAVTPKTGDAAAVLGRYILWVLLSVSNAKKPI